MARTPKKPTQKEMIADIVDFLVETDDKTRVAQATQLKQMGDPAILQVITEELVSRATRHPQTETPSGAILTLMFLGMIGLWEVCRLAMQRKSLPLKEFAMTALALHLHMLPRDERKQLYVRLHVTKATTTEFSQPLGCLEILTLLKVDDLGEAEVKQEPCETASVDVDACYASEPRKIRF